MHIYQYKMSEMLELVCGGRGLCVKAPTQGRRRTALSRACILERKQSMTCFPPISLYSTVQETMKVISYILVW